ncbi:deoxyguanosinetriphosphate triphosphohydrolase [Sneathiella chinensis]|uniref:Deoxyguanosinetriphosphate triphosphohydrolase-like protein n=1 Tax=Sneathiella chinensis TaxID=349750 RepID=A0ABQ5U7W4_9PROT|nr:deoxyguanosinetriphosphate triphosphohydrolase [Sneathiella chinensis]GLQ08003.1 deoxyguanosinetriphosphate triphosphohydrolase-like protein [Sneathiella chinensis]
MMEWNKLLSTKRFGQDQNEPIEASRSPFHKDQDRIVFSSAFRRLQDKTQVHSLAESDYVRTRLTHSMEVASVGRSLGANAGQIIIDRHLRDKGYNTAEFGHIVSAACLAHDIGNPPFGHFGEDTIRHWFKTVPLARGDLSPLSAAQKEDFLRFEGNAQGFRVLTKLQNWRNRGGLRLTYATLGTFMKYPRTSDVQKPLEGDAAGKKFGIMQSELNQFREVAREIGLIQRGKETYWCRHPLTYLVEAADDICYSVVDIEDGFKLGRLEFAETESLMLRILGRAPKRYSEFTDNSEKISYLRAKCIGRLIGEVSEIFADHESEILEGTYKGDLLKHSSHAGVFQEIEQLCRNQIFNHRERVQAELRGTEIISTILDALFTANMEWEEFRNNGTKPSPKSSVVINLLNARSETQKSRYDWILEVTDFVSGMTDSFSVRQFKDLKGFM